MVEISVDPGCVVEHICGDSMYCDALDENCRAISEGV